MSGSLLIHQNLRDGSPDQTLSPVFLNGADDVERDLAGPTFWVVGTSFVVMKEKSINQDAGVPWRHP